MRKEYSKKEIVCPNMGCDCYRKILYKEDYTAEDILYVIKGLESKDVVVPFACVYNAAILMSKRKRDKRYYDDTNEYADVNQYLYLAQQAPEGELAYLKAKRFYLIGKLATIGKIWGRSYGFCDVVDHSLVEKLTKVYQTIILDQDSLMNFFYSLIDFHIECNAIQELDKRIAELESCQQKAVKYMYFETTLSDRKLIAIRDVLVDCKGGSYGKDKRYLSPISDDDWLYLFGRKASINVTPPKWLGSDQIIMNVMQLICGTGSILKPIVKKQFQIENPPKADRKSTPTALREKLESIISQ